MESISDNRRNHCARLPFPFRAVLFCGSHALLASLLTSSGLQAVIDRFFSRTPLLPYQVSLTFKPFCNICSSRVKMNTYLVKYMF